MSAMKTGPYNYGWLDAAWGEECECGHPKEQHAHPGALGTPCGHFSGDHSYPCPCLGFRRVS